MTIYVDSPQRVGPKHNQMIWRFRLFTDPTDDLNPLIRFAESMGVHSSKFHEAVMPHYDVSALRHNIAISRGAVLLNKYRVKDIEQAWRKFWSESQADNRET